MLIATSIGLIGLATLVAVYLMFGTRIPFEGVSLPCMTVLTSGIYFYLMPFLALDLGGGLEDGFFGMYIQSLEWPHFAVFLYTLGATAAFFVHIRRLAVNPAKSVMVEKQINWKYFYGLSAITLAGLGYKFITGRLNLFGAQNYEFSTTSSSILFVNLFLTSMISLTIVYLIHDKFKWRSLLILAFVFLIFLQTGFRYRLIILAAGAFGSYMIVNAWKIRMLYVVAGSTVGVFLSNIVGTARQGYGNGIDFSKIEQMSFTDIFQSFGGEVGPIYVITDITSTPLPNLVYFDPWLVGFARLVPSIIWPGKPTADYLQYFTKGFWVESANQAGIAAPQQVEMLLQFGWFGLPFLAFLYFSIAALLMTKLHKLSREARIAGCALIPIFFGFYMQTRGYFFQTLSDGLFLFGPLFLMHVGMNRVRRSRARFIKPLSRTPF